MKGVIGMLRVSFLKSVIVAVCFTSQALAGHDVMVHLAIYNDGPFEVEHVPAVFGVPLPASDDPVDPKNLILVGADAFQVRPLSHWPNGSIRWLMVEAIVNVQPSADRAVVHLTTGQRPRELPNIASEIPNGYLLNTGKCTIRIEESESVLCTLESIEREEVPDFSIQLSSENEKFGFLKSRRVVLENNGPVTATVAVIEQYEYSGVPLEFTRRCKVFKGFSRFTISSALARLPISPCHPDIIAIETLVSWPQLKTHLGNSWEIDQETRAKNQIVQYSAADHLIQMRSNQLIHEDSIQINVVKNIFSRAWAEFDLSLNENRPVTFMPFLGVAVSAHVYNDSQCLADYVQEGKGDGEVGLGKSMIPTTQLSDFLYDIMGKKLLPTPLVTTAMNQWISKAGSIPKFLQPSEDQEWKDESRFSEAGLYSTWYFLTGDEALRKLRLAWAAHEPIAYVPLASTSFEQWDAFLLDGSIDRRDAILSNLGNWIDDTLRKSLLKRIGLSTFRLVSNVIRQGGLEGFELGEWLDRFEKLVHKYRTSNPHDVLFAEGYRITGEAEFLREGKNWLKEKGTVVPDNNAITGMVENIQRQYTWRWLEVNAEDLGEQGWELSWTTPKNVVRYRFKQSDKPITNIPQPGNELETTSFCSADDLELDYSLSYPGSFHSFLISKSLTKGNRFFAIRYLERGPDLPAPAIKQTATSAVDSPGNAVQTPSYLRKYAWLGLVLIAGGMVLIFKRKRT